MRESYYRSQPLYGWHSHIIFVQLSHHRLSFLCGRFSWYPSLIDLSSWIFVLNWPAAIWIFLGEPQSNSSKFNSKKPPTTRRLKPLGAYLVMVANDKSRELEVVCVKTNLWKSCVWLKSRYLPSPIPSLATA